MRGVPKAQLQLGNSDLGKHRQKRERVVTPPRTQGLTYRHFLSLGIPFFGKKGSYGPSDGPNAPPFENASVSFPYPTCFFIIG